jgi:hypothetical protein
MLDSMGSAPNMSSNLTTDYFLEVNREQKFGFVTDGLSLTKPKGGLGRAIMHQ